MYCPDCGLDNRQGARFCGNCGLKLSDLPGFKKSVSPKKIHKPSRKKKIKKKKVSIIDSSIVPKAPVKSPASASNSEIGEYPVKLLTVNSMLDNRYKILQHIATGGMGAIYKAKDTRFNTIVAVKEMLDFFSKEEDRKYAIQRFREEAMILVNLRHTNVPRVTDNFIQNNRYYLIMDFIEGKSTEKLLFENKSKGLNPKKVIKWAVQICDVLYYLHSQNPPIIYRDMKPSNVMITPDDKAMIIDFGIARHFTPRRPGTMIGTHGYAPPEQYKGNTEPRSDLYALGATLHHIISGIDPTQGVPFNFKPIRNYQKNVSVDLENILKKALENIVNNRFHNALEMKKALLSTSEFSGSNNNIKSQKYSQPNGKSPQPKIEPSPEAKYYILKAKEYAQKGNFYRARKELEKSLKICPKCVESIVLMGYVLTKMGNPKDAAKLLNKAVSISPDSATAHLYLGKAYAKLGNQDASNKEIMIAGRLDPELLKNTNQSFLEKLIRSFLS